MAYSKIYQRINWKNEPSNQTPLNEENLNKMDEAIDELDNRTVKFGDTFTDVAIESNGDEIVFTDSSGEKTNIKTYALKQSLLKGGSKFIAGGKNSFVKQQFLVEKNYTGNATKGIKFVNFLSTTTFQIKAVRFFKNKDGQPSTVDLSDSLTRILDGNGVKAEYDSDMKVLNVTLPQYTGIFFYSPQNLEFGYGVEVVYYNEGFDTEVYLFDNDMTNPTGSNPTGQHEAGKLKDVRNGIYGQTLIMRDYGSNTFQSIVATGNEVSASKLVNASPFSPYELYFFDMSQDRNTSPGQQTATQVIYKTFRRFDARYTLNCGETLTPDNPVYLVGTITDGAFELNSEMYAQAIPKAENGFVYIYIGEAITNHEINLDANNLVYVYKNGSIQLFSESGSAEQPIFADSDTISFETKEEEITETIKAELADTTYSPVDTASITATDDMVSFANVNTLWFKLPKPLKPNAKSIVVTVTVSSWSNYQERAILCPVITNIGPGGSTSAMDIESPILHLVDVAEFGKGSVEFSKLTKPCEWIRMTTRPYTGGTGFHDLGSGTITDITVTQTLTPNEVVTAKVKEGSINEKHLRPDYLADIRVESAKAESSAKSAAQSAEEAKEIEKKLEGVIFIDETELTEKITEVFN